MHKNAPSLGTPYQVIHIHKVTPHEYDFTQQN